MVTRRALKQHMEEEDNQWILESPMTISKMGNQSVSTATNTDTWQRNAKWKRKNEKHERVLNAIKRDTLPKTVKENR